MKLIGIEEHFLTAEIRDAWHSLQLEALDPSVAFHSGANDVPVRPGKWGAEGEVLQVIPLESYWLGATEFSVNSVRGSPAPSPIL